MGCDSPQSDIFRAARDLIELTGLECWVVGGFLERPVKRLDQQL